MKRKTNKVKCTRLVILTYIAVSPVSILTHPVRSAVLHTRLTSWARATGPNPPVSRSSAGRNWHALACPDMSSEWSFPFSLMLVQPVFLFCRMTWILKDPNFHLLYLLWDDSLRTWKSGVRDPPFVSIKIPLSRPPTLVETRSEGKGRKRTLLCLLGLLSVAIVTRWGCQLPGRTDTCCIIHFCNA